MAPGDHPGGHRRRAGALAADDDARGLRGATVADVGVGVRLGRAWILLGGVVPVEHDGLRLAEVGPSHFHERSTALLLRCWEHRRTVTPAGPASSTGTDRVRAVPRGPVRRLPGATRVVMRLLDLLLAHRQRRLRRWARGCTHPSPGP